MKKFKRILSFLLTLIIVLSCLMITAYADEINSSSPSGSSVVEYSVDPGWKATIPAYVKAADQGQQDPSAYTVTIYDVLLGDQQKLVATIDYDGVLEEENGIQLKYSLYDSDGKIGSEKRFAEIPAGDPDEEYTYTFGAALDEKPKYAGNYLGTVMFNLAVEDIYYTAEEIEKNPLLFPIGKTVPEYVVAEFSDDYSIATIFKNGKDSDGLMKDWTSDVSPFYRSNTLVTAVIKDGVKNIGKHVFLNSPTLSVVTVFDSVETIGVGAFEGCSSLSKLSIGNGVRNIENSAFRNCKSLINVEFPDSLETIGNYSFMNCGFVELYVGNNVKNLGDNAFGNCKELVDVTISKSVESVGDYAFVYCESLKSVTFQGKYLPIPSTIFVKASSDIIIYAHTESTAEAFAKAKGYTFIALEE